MVRAFSHLPEMKEAEDEATPHQDGMAAGVFDAVRQQLNRSGSPHYMDEDGNIRPRDEARQEGSPAPRDARNPQSGAGTPTRPAWSTCNAADSSRSLRAAPSASDDTRPWYSPPIKPGDLDPRHSDEDSAPKRGIRR